MSRSNYSDDYEHLNLWRGAVERALLGKRGQKLLNEMLVALDAMPNKVLILGDLEKDGRYCALGVLGAARGLPLASMDPHDSEGMAKAFNIAPAMVCEIAYRNDECGWIETHVGRWLRMRRWVAENIIPGDA